MNFYRVVNPISRKLPQDSIILVNSKSHPKRELVILPTKDKPGNYNPIGPPHAQLDYKSLAKKGHIIPLTHQELWKASHHMPWRIWTLDASPLLNSAATALDAMDILANSAKKVRLIPPAICFSCMKKGNPFIVKMPQIIDKLGTCRVCGKRATLRATAYATPLNFRPSFGRFIAPLEFTEDPSFYKDRFIVESWWELYGYKEPNNCPEGYEYFNGNCRKGRELLLEELRKANNEAEELSARLHFAEETISRLEAEKESLMDQLEEFKSFKKTVLSND